MEKQNSWRRASLSTFELSKDSPFLDKSLALTKNSNRFDEDLKNGYEQGINQAQQELNEVKHSFEKIFESLIQYTTEIDEEIIYAIAKLAISISKQIIRRELQINSDQVVSVAKEAINLLPLENNRLVIHLNPQDVQIIKKVFKQDDVANTYSIVEDPSIQMGGCKIATDESIIDASIESQIAQIAAAILGSQRTSSHSNES